MVGDGCTTTSVGMAAAWPQDDPCMIAEFDPAGGCLTAWLDVPRSPGLADVAASSTPGSWETIKSMVQRAASGIDVLVAKHCRLSKSAGFSKSATVSRAFTV